jgi:hypothetical protein
VNDFGHFGKEALEMFSVKKCPAKAGFEGFSPSFSVLAEHLKCAQNAHGVNEINFLRDHQYSVHSLERAVFFWLKCVD